MVVFFLSWQWKSAKPRFIGAFFVIFSLRISHVAGGAVSESPPIWLELRLFGTNAFVSERPLSLLMVAA